MTAPTSSVACSIVARGSSRCCCCSRSRRRRAVFHQIKRSLQINEETHTQTQKAKVKREHKIRAIDITSTRKHPPSMSISSHSSMHLSASFFDLKSISPVLLFLKNRVLDFGLMFWHMDVKSSSSNCSGRFEMRTVCVETFIMDAF